MTKRISIILITAITFINFIAQAQLPVPAKANTKKILLLNGYAHLGNGQVIENSAIAFEADTISMVADARVIKIDRNYYDEVINLEGKHVYPGIIAPNSTLGITEIDAVRATQDFRETGKYKPHVRSIVAYNTESRVSSTVRTNGVLFAQITPRGGRITGTSSIVELDAWNWEDAAYKLDDAIHINWPGMLRWSWKDRAMLKNDKQQEEITELRNYFNEAEAYAEVENYQEQNIRMEALRGVFDGSKNVFVNVNYVREIIQVVNFKRELNIKKLVIIGGYDSWRVTDMLKENDIAVMIRRPHDLPQRPEDDVDLPYKLPYLLQKAGVEYCIQNAGDMEAMGARNIPFLAGTACAYGLTKEEALSAITLNSAKILGIDRSVGSIEVGKDATIFISTGDALDMRTNNVTQAFVRGKTLDLNNPQTELYNKYKAKYEN